MSYFRISLNKDKALLKKMHELDIREEDLWESFMRSSGPGGQKVNKTSSCVYLKHLPTGIEVKCQKERSQVLNRYLARKLLADKIEKLRLKKLIEERQLEEKIRRQARGRSEKIKLKIREEKRQHAEKKRLRAKIRGVEIE